MDRNDTLDNLLTMVFSPKRYFWDEPKKDLQEFNRANPTGCSIPDPTLTENVPYHPTPCKVKGVMFNKIPYDIELVFELLVMFCYPFHWLFSKNKLSWADFRADMLPETDEVWLQGTWWNR